MTRHFWSLLRLVEIGLFTGLIFFVFGCTDCGDQNDHIKRFQFRGKIWRIWYHKDQNGIIPLNVTDETGKSYDPADESLPFGFIGSDTSLDVFPVGGGVISPALARLPGAAAATAPYYAYILSTLPTDALYILDQKTAKTIATIPLKTQPQGVAAAPSGNEIYVTNLGIEAGNPFFPQAPPRVSVISKASRGIVATIDLAVGQAPGKPVVSPDERFVYVPVSPDTRQNANATGGVVVIDAQSRSVVTTIPVSVPSSPLRRAALTPDGAILFVTATETIPARVFAIDTFTREQIAVIASNASLRDLLVNYTGSRLYLLTQTSLVAIDTATLIETGTLPVRNPARLNGMALSIDGRSLFINDELATSILRVDTTKFQVAETISFPGRANPDSSSLMIVP
jgi:DNA-binding beta-propeller fold protein YncE